MTYNGQLKFTITRLLEQGLMTHYSNLFPYYSSTLSFYNNSFFEHANKATILFLTKVSNNVINSTKF